MKNKGFVCFAFLLAPLAPAVFEGFAQAGSESGILDYALLAGLHVAIMYVFTLLLAVPLYLLLRRKYELSFLLAAGTGFVIGIFSAVIFGLALDISIIGIEGLLRPSTSTITIGGELMQIEARKTLQGYLFDMKYYGRYGMLGSVTGAIFYLLNRHVFKMQTDKV